MKKLFTSIKFNLFTALEIAPLKRYSRLGPFIFFVCCALLISSCEENEKVSPADDPDVENPDLDEDIDLPDIPVSKGHIGLVLDTRSIVKKGYKPAYASVEIDGSLSSFSNNHIEIDDFTNLATLRISRDSIPEGVLDQFIKGVPVSITVYDDENQVLAKMQEDNFPINASASALDLKTEKPKIKLPLKIISGARYLIAAKPIEGYEGGTVWSYHSDIYNQPIMLYDNFITNSQSVGQEFIFEPTGNDSTFYIKAVSTGSYLKMKAGRLSMDPFGDLFVLSPDDDGWITIKKNEAPLRIDVDYLSTDIETTLEAKFKLVSAGIEWKAQDVGITFSNPIMPPAQIEFAINSPIRNCAPSTIKQTIGKEDVRITTISAGTQESFSVTTTHEARVDASVSIGVSVDLFGVAGVEKNYSLSAGYTYTDTETKTSTNHFEATSTVETRVSFVREVTVHPYSAVNVYDAVQTYKNVQMPYVQKLRVSAVYEGVALTGEEITSQLIANQFGGVVTETGSNYVLITVRGTIQIENLMEARTDSTPIPCPNVPD